MARKVRVCTVNKYKMLSANNWWTSWQRRNPEESKSTGGNKPQQRGLFTVTLGLAQDSRNGHPLGCGKGLPFFRLANERDYASLPGHEGGARLSGEVVPQNHNGDPGAKPDLDPDVQEEKQHD